jgi:hypothetical protein
LTQPAVVYVYVGLLSPYVIVAAEAVTVKGAAAMFALAVVLTLVT